MKIEWLLTAQRRRQSQLDYIGERNARTALDLSEAITTSVQMLASRPYIGRPGRVDGTHELVIVGTPFLVIYRVQADVVRIIRLLHTAQRWPK